MSTPQATPPAPSQPEPNPAPPAEPPSPFEGVYFEHRLGQIIKRHGNETLWMVPIEVLASGHMHVLEQQDSSDKAKQLARAWLDVLQLADDKARLEGVDVIFTEPEVGDDPVEDESKFDSDKAEQVKDGQEQAGEPEAEPGAA